MPKNGSKQQQPYELKLIQGVPFFVNDVGDVFNYDTNQQPVRIGEYNSAANILKLSDNWREVLEPSLFAWRSGLCTGERGKVRTEKQRVPKRNPRKAAAAKAPKDSAK